MKTKRFPKCLLLLLFSVLAFSCTDNGMGGGGSTNNNGKEQTMAGLKDGINILGDDSLGFVLFAPYKKSVYLIGDFNNWQVSDKYKMKQNGDRFWIRIGGLQKGKEYICQYLIDDTMRIADPYTNKISDPVYDAQIPSSVYPNLISYPTGKTSQIAMVVNTAPANYSWKVGDFKLSDTQKQNMVIYEILIRDFTDSRSIKGVQDKISYLKDLGVTAVELMPFNEFEGNNSWGYNPSFYFATDKAYGTSDDFKAFIDACHENGIAVIMDMVLNHSYGSSPMVRMYQNPDGTVSSQNPWFNQKSPNPAYSYGYDFNHESQYTQAFVDSVCSYWMNEYKIDGYRFDFTKGFTNTPGDGYAMDPSRIAILERMTSQIWKRKPGEMVIFEHFTDNSEETILSNYGIYLWGNMNYNYNQMTMGWDQNDIGGTSYQSLGWSKPNLVAYMESHDEERIMFKNEAYGNSNGSYNVKDLNTGLKRTEAAAVLLMSFPGPKMIWQFGELGYDYELNSNNGNGRLEEKPIRWDYYDVSARKELHDVFAKMDQLRTTNPIFYTTTYQVSVGEGPIKQILLMSASGYACAVANFGLQDETASVNFGKTGKWKDYFSGTEINVTSSSQNINLSPGQYYLFMSE